MISSKNACGWFCGFFIVALSLLSMSGANAQILWYNGDVDTGPNADNIFATESPGYTGTVYEAFTVTASGGWDVSGVFGNFLLADQAVSSANWAILTGVSSGNAGSVVASGTSSDLTLTPSGSPDEYGNTLTNVAVNGLNVDLTPGTYWFDITPVTDAYGYLATTLGLNSVGTTPGDSGKAYYSETSLGSTYGGNYFTSTTSVAPADPYLVNFSMGVNGTAVTPEPSTWALLLIGMGLLSGYWRRRLKRS